MSHGLMTEGLMATITQSDPQAKARMRDFLEKRAGKVLADGVARFRGEAVLALVGDARTVQAMADSGLHWWQVPIADMQTPDAHTLAAWHAVAPALREALPADAVVVTDGGDFLSFARVGLPASTYLDPGSLGCIGVGTPFGVAAALACPGRLVLVATGDGSFGFNAMELDTAVRHRAPVLVVVANNGSWAIEVRDQQETHGKAGGTRLQFADPAAMARAFGAHGERVERAEDLPAAIARAKVALAEGRPALLDVLVTPEAAAAAAQSGRAGVPAPPALAAAGRFSMCKHDLHGCRETTPGWRRGHAAGGHGPHRGHHLGDHRGDHRREDDADAGLEAGAGGGEDVRIGHDHRHVGVAHGKCRTALDPGGTVADDPVEILLQLCNDPLDTFGGQVVLVASLRGRQQEQGFEALVADQRLRQLGIALDDVDQIVDDAALGAHHQIEIAKTDVEIDDDDFFIALCQRCTESGRRGGLADPALAGCHDYHLAHVVLLSVPAQVHVILSVMIASPSSQS